MEEKDYKKLYEDVVALAKDGLKDGLYLSHSAKEVTEFLFPQLKETKDEKIRRELTTFLINFNNGYYSRPSEDKIDSWIKWIDKKASDIEKQSKQKAVDEVKPKFKVGDWIVQENIGIYKIIEICESWYEVLDNKDNHYSIGFDKEDMCHLWAIQDAKDGDVLSTENPFIFRGFGDRMHPNNPTAYCGINTSNTFVLAEENDWWTSNAVHPATEEQRSLLFQKMKEAGYEWDTEKKELNKIEKKPDIVEALRTEYEKGRADAIAEMNPTWSEDDEKKMNKLVSLCTNFKNGNTQLYSVYLEFQELIDWLKSIRHRHITYELDAPLGYDKDMNPIYPTINHWRPSPEQMRAVFDASERNDKLGSVLRNLYDDLKKL